MFLLERTSFSDIYFQFQIFEFETIKSWSKVLNDFLANFNIFACRDISVSRLGHPLIGTASADKTARIWGKFK